MLSRPLLLGAILIGVPGLVRPQSGIIEQDSSLNNLVHAAGYIPAPLGSLGPVIRRGSGPIDVLLVPGWGFSAGDFEDFMRAHERRYRMVAVTLPGFGGSAAPPMPPSGTSYAVATWTRAAEDAVARLIRTEGLRNPIVIGHFIVGTQVAIGLATRHPGLIGGLVIVGGEPMRFIASRRDSSGRTPMPRDERAKGMDEFFGPRWFRTVTKRSFDENNYAAVQYSRDSSRARALWKRSAEVPLPVMIRYLSEYMATDVQEELVKLHAPMRVLVPGFSTELLSNPKQSYAKSLFIDSWDSVRVRNPRIVIDRIAGAHVFVTDDRPDVVRQAIDDVARAAERRRTEARRD